MRRFLFHNFRILFALSRWTRQHLTPAGFLVLGSLIAAGVFGIDTQKTLAYQLFSLLFALLLLAILSSLFFKIRLTAQRDLPKFATVGEILHYQVRVQNHTQKLQRNLTLQENFKWHPPSFETFLRAREPGHEKRNWFDNYVGYPRWLWLMNLGKGAEVAESDLPSLPPKNSKINFGLQTLEEKNEGGELEVKMTLTPLRRGYVHFTRMIFARPDPFGLFKALYMFEKADSLLILPKRYLVGEIKLAGTKKYQRGGVQLAMSIGDAEEFMSLRDYRPGDPLRHIHWKSWAKVGKPIVKEFQDEFFVRHALILDTFTEQAFSDVFESAVSVAASFACAPRSHEVLLDLMFVGTQAYRFTSGRGLAQTDKLLEVLACVEVCTEPQFEQLSSLVLEQVASLSGCICVLLNWDKARQQFIQSLKNAGIPLLVVIISHTELEIDTQKFPEVHVLLLNEIVDGLKKITYL
jgi:uncharacterized protein (DUF58 family)